MTIQELKRRNQQNGGVFFDRKTMQWWGDTMSNFRIEKLTPITVRVTRKRKVRNGGMGSWIFNAVTGRMIA